MLKTIPQKLRIRISSPEILEKFPEKALHAFSNGGFTYIHTHITRPIEGPLSLTFSSENRVYHVILQFNKIIHLINTALLQLHKLLFSLLQLFIPIETVIIWHSILRRRRGRLLSKEGLYSEKKGRKGSLCVFACLPASQPSQIGRNAFSLIQDKILFRSLSHLEAVVKRGSRMARPVDRRV